ncbi:MAG: pseudouridine synthase [Deinococcales bacterium]
MMSVKNNAPKPARRPSKDLTKSGRFERKSPQKGRATKFKAHSQAFGVNQPKPKQSQESAGQDLQEGERLQKYLANLGIGSRRKIEALISEGKIKVDGRTAVLGMKVKGHEEIVVDGKEIMTSIEKVTLMLYKPVGVISTVKDSHNRPTVMDYVPKIAGLHPVGRLDSDSEGLLLLSNDGDLTLKLTHPRYGHQKEYRVWCAEGSLSPEALAMLRAGIELEDGLAKALKAVAVPEGAVISLGDGRKRQLRRMLEHLNYTITRLKRLRINHLDLGDLQEGEYRYLKAEDFRKLKL